MLITHLNNFKGIKLKGRILYIKSILENVDTLNDC